MLTTTNNVLLRFLCGKNRIGKIFWKILVSLRIYLYKKKFNEMTLILWMSPEYVYLLIIQIRMYDIVQTKTTSFMALSYFMIQYFQLAFVYQNHCIYWSTKLWWYLQLTPSVGTIDSRCSTALVSCSSATRKWRGRPLSRSARASR